MKMNKLLAAMLLVLVALPTIAQRTATLGPAANPTGPSNDVSDASSASNPKSSAPSPNYSGSDLTAADVNAWLDGYMPYALRTGDIAGAQITVVKDGEILASRGFGYANVAKRTPVDPHRTLFRLGSVGKLFTWTAVMQQVEQGKIDLDVDINRYLDFKIPERAGGPITMRNLLQHTPGFEESIKDALTTDPKAAISTEVWLKRWTPKRVFAAGTTPAYSNYGASLAGYIVERVSGEPFDNYIERHILVPLDMRRSTFRQPLPATLAPFMSKGYNLASEDPEKFEIFSIAPAGSLSSTADDMANFMIAYLQDGTFGSNRILLPETVETMHNSPLTLLPPLNRMELGFFETSLNGQQITGHHGDTNYFHTSLHLLRAEGVGFYVSLNSSGKEGAAGQLRTALFDGFADRYFPGNVQDGRVDAKTAAKHAQMMAGNWIVSRGGSSSFLSIIGFLGQFKLSVGPKGELVVPFPGLNGKPREWVEIAPFVWRDTGSHQRLAAKLEDGKVVRFSFDLVAPFMVWERAPWYKNSAWLMPFFLAGLAAIVLTALQWPIAAGVRRHFGATLALDPRNLRARRFSNFAALAIIAALASWLGAFVFMSTDPIGASSAFDPVLWLVQIISAVGFIGGFAAMLWNLWVVWTGKRRWPAKVWSVVLALSALAVLWVAFAFKLLAFTVNY